jgi:hypothetical protein
VGDAGRVFPVQGDGEIQDKVSAANAEWRRGSRAHYQAKNNVLQATASRSTEVDT